MPQRGIRTARVVQPKNLAQHKEPSFVLLLVAWCLWIYVGQLLLENFGGTQLPIIDLILWFVNVVTTTGIYKHGVNGKFNYKYVLKMTVFR